MFSGRMNNMFRSFAFYLVMGYLVILAAGSLEPAALLRGHEAVETLVAHMDAGRRQRLARLGFDSAEAEKLSGLHTRNFM